MNTFPDALERFSPVDLLVLTSIGSSAFDVANIIYLNTKQATLSVKLSTVLSLPLQSVFPATVMEQHALKM